jgi:arsenite-transporting ATPase
MPLSGLDDQEFKLIFFGGKGGVGKTSCAVATAMKLSERYKTLLISTDPAHSVSDSLEQTIGSKLQNVKGFDSLSAIEIGADEAFEEFKKQHQAELEKLFDTSTGLDNDDINQLLSLSIPGIDEMMSFKTVMDLIEGHDFEKYVVDTAPTGHFLRLLSSPKILDQWIKVAVQLRWKYRYMVTRFSGSYEADDTDDMLLKLKKTTKHIDELFRDSRHCEFIPVCIPEAMAVFETNRLLADLKKSGILVRQFIINDVMELGTCSFCLRKKESQQKYLTQIGETYGRHLEITKVPSFPEEIKGFGQLNALKEVLFGYAG